MHCPDCHNRVSKNEGRCHFCGLDLKKFKSISSVNLGEEGEIPDKEEFKADVVNKKTKVAAIMEEAKQEDEETVVEGDGNKQAESSNVINEMGESDKPMLPPTDMVAPKNESEVVDYEEIDTDREIPGRGFLFQAKDQHLPEATRLNEREVWAFAVGAVQDAVLDPGRTESVFAIFSKKVMRNKISLNGDGRTEYVTTMQLKAEEKAEKNGDIFAKRP